MDTIKIPKIIHYCWFGGSEKPAIVKKCIATWQKCLHEYEIREWNEENFDVNCNSFVKEAYHSKKFAFVSDYVRAYVLYHYGGIYLDTDVEVFKSFDNLLNLDSFWGFEQENYIATSTIGAAKGNNLIGEFLSNYEEKNFIKQDGTINDLTNVKIITKILEQFGLIRNGKFQDIEGIGTFFPQTYFSPYDYINCRNLKTHETYTIHYFYKSWLPLSTRIKTSIKVILSKIIGGDNIFRIRKLVLKYSGGKQI